MSEAARSRRDEARYEPYVAMPSREAAPADPLAELARLVGQDDPFRNVFRPAATVAQAAPAPAPHAGVDHHHAGDEHLFEEQAYADDADAAYGSHEDGQGYHDHAYHDADAARAHGTEAEHHAAPDHGYAGGGDGYDEAGPASHGDEAGLADERFQPGYAGAALADQWARSDAGTSPDIDHEGGPVVLSQSSSARRPIAVLAAVLLLTGGGLAASFLVKGGSVAAVTSAGAGRGAPTIMAAAGPTKVKVDDGSATAPEDQDAALLNRNATVSSGPVKIVSSQEQPADLGQLPKSDLADGARPLPPAAPSPFPEPKKVKTFLVHPDGTMLSGDPAPAPTGPSGVSAPAPSTGGDVVPAALPATPKTAVRGGTTPKAAAATPAPTATIASLSADPVTTETAAPRTARTPPPAPAAGSYGVQLASSPVEADANAAFAKLKKKYPAQLGSYTATVHKADTGDKPVYRVRVGGMSQDEAKTLCSQLQSAGGSCFVMHN